MIMFSYRLCFLLLVCLASPLLAQAKRIPASSSATTLQLRQESVGFRLEWRAAITTSSADAAHDGWSTLRIGDVDLPVRLITVRAVDGLPIQPRIEHLETTNWPEEASALSASSAPKAAQVSSEDRDPEATAKLPSAPITVLREGRFRGTRLVVLMFSPLFADASGIQSATQLTTTVPGTTLIDEQALPAMAHSKVSHQPIPALLNPHAAVTSIVIRVSQPGMQRVTGAALLAAGLDLAALVPGKLQLWSGQQQVAIEERGTADGHLAATDELRFYAHEVGDRWNKDSFYWLVLGSAPGQRMNTRSALPQGAPLRTTAIDEGVWRQHKLYESVYAGVDGDHWFSANLQTGPGRPPANLDALLQPNLPLAPGTTILTISGSAFTPNSHDLSVQLGTATATARWNGAGDWTQTFSLGDNHATAKLTLHPGTVLDGVKLDTITWQRPVSLNFGGQGRLFRGLSGQWRYQLTNLPDERSVYDVSDPYAPSQLTIQNGTAIEFEDTLAARRYLLTGPGTLHTPQVAAHAPADLSAPLNADVLYIAPRAFHEAVAPLVRLRQAQGLTAQIVDVQAIYAAWSFGHVSPQAIRQFLQYATATWEQPPSTVVLVGDGTSDPLNYTGRNNANIIPPYLAMVDPWLGETACETCYGQLDGSDPLSDPLPELTVGRLPVKHVSELEGLVTKLIQYETSSPPGDWRSRAVYIADNADQAGDFPALADLSAAMQPAGVRVERVYYDPAAAQTGATWRESNPLRARQRTIDAINAGAALVNYIGHGYYWQWGLTDPTVSNPNLIELYDADALTNGRKLPIVLTMTCYTSGFQQPSYSGTTIDERLILQPSGGAAAVWGPTGLGVAHGHDLLQRGFYQALWDAPAQSQSLGDLVQAGYLELFAHGTCCQDTLRTYAILGDPALTPQIGIGQHSYLPLLRR